MRFLNLDIKPRSTILLCFSPPVMLATIAIELALAILIAVKFATSSTRRIIITLLICLAAFQLAELRVCGATIPDLVWSRIGYVFITALPPLGIHLVVKLRKQALPGIVWPAYTLGLMFALAFAFAPTALNRGVCTGNYVIFLLSQPLATYYSWYYYGLQFVGLALTLAPRRKATANQIRALRWMAVAYAVIIIPTFIVVVLLPYTHLAIPSIMCGFAVLFALILGLKIAPLALRHPKPLKNISPSR
jgi:hypothetical protein